MIVRWSSKGLHIQDLMVNLQPIWGTIQPLDYRRYTNGFADAWFDFTPENLAYLSRVAYISFTVQCKAYSFFGDFRELHSKVLQLRRYGDLYKHQRESLVESLKFMSYGFLAETGSGKTAPAILNMEYRAKFLGITQFLILCRPILVGNWVKEINEWSDVLEPIPLYGNLDKRSRLLQDNQFRPTVYITNYESLIPIKSKKNKESLTFEGQLTFAERLAYWNWDSIMLDESQKIKNIDAKRTQTLMQMSQSAKHKIILTGTPSTESPLDAYSQFYFLDPRILGYRNYNQMRYMHTFKENSRPKNIEMLAEKIKAMSYRVLKSECLDLPEKIFQTITLDMPDDMEQAYREMARDMKTTVGDKVLEAEYVITQVMRFQQILSGSGFNANPKLDFITDLIESQLVTKEARTLEGSPKKITIWYHYNLVLEQLLSAMPKNIPHFVLKGGLGAQSLTKTKDDFVNYPDNAILIAQEQTAGEGITLTCSDLVVFYENTYSLDIYKQKQDRHHRIGTKTNPVYYNLTYKRTVDNSILRILQDKTKLAAKITGDALYDFISGGGE